MILIQTAHCYDFVVFMALIRIIQCCVGSVMTQYWLKFDPSDFGAVAFTLFQTLAQRSRKTTVIFPVKLGQFFGKNS